PGIAGIGNADYTDPATFGAGFRTATVIGAGLLALAAIVSAVAVRTSLGGAPSPGDTAPGDTAPDTPSRVPLERCSHCGITAPQTHPRD
ncbi:MAG TPA: MFS transporter, partial [Pseudonocardia sp.]|nr:MFS transporter [Pseudonocardia sp.]